MAVFCEGDRLIVEQLGEKQDFESELSRHAIAHEVFALNVLRKRDRRNAEWNQDYSVTVTHVASGRSKVYEGGPRRNWVARCAQDLAQGFYGASSHRT